MSFFPLTYKKNNARIKLENNHIISFTERKIVMKKFLAVFFTLIFALSSFTVAFAADHECPNCHVVFDDAAWSEHVSKGCSFGKTTACRYCNNPVATENLATHELDCPKGAKTCDVCHQQFETQRKYNAHLDTCKEDAASDIVDGFIGLVQKIDWAKVGEKAAEIIKSIPLDKILASLTPIFEKIVALFNTVPAK